jgi:hypothetical protein
MSIHVINTTLTFCWAVPVNVIPLVKADFDIRLTLPDGTVTYTDDGVTTYTAPTATTQGEVTYDLAVGTNVGRHIVELMVGTSLAHVLQAQRRIYIVNPPSYISLGFTHNPYQGPAVIPEIPPEPPGDPGTYELEDLAYLDIQTQASAELSGNTSGLGILDGWYQTYYFLDAGVPDQAVPLSWGDYQEYGSIREAFEHSTAMNFRWGYLDAPAIAGEDNPYSLLENTGKASGYMGTILEHWFPGETDNGTFFNITWDTGLADVTDRFFFSAEGGAPSNVIPTEYDVTANDNDRIGIGLVGTRLPSVTANWTAASSNQNSGIGVHTLKYDVAADASNIYISCNQGEILRSTDNGTTWADCFDLAGTQIFLKIVAGNGIVMAIDSTEVVYTSSNGGTNWTNQGALPQLGSVNTLQYFDGVTKYFIVGGFLGSAYRLYRTTDGITWTEFGTGITSNIKKAYPFIGDSGSGLELFLYYLDASITSLSPTDANETAFQTPTSATDIRSLYVENGLTIFRDSANGMIAYNGTTEYTHNGYNWDIDPILTPNYKEGTKIILSYRNLLLQGTSAEWLTQDGITLAKVPMTYDDFAIGNRVVKQGANWVWVINVKGETYLNSVGY